MDHKKSNTKYYIAGGALAVILLLVTVIAITGYNPFPEKTTTTPTVGNSAFELYSAVDGEDISNFATMDIWVPKSGATFDDGYDDITALTKNFEKEESGKDADDISLDLSGYRYVWAEIVGNSVWENTFYLIFPGGTNRVHRYNVHHMSSAVPFNINVKNTGANMTIYTETAGGSLDANYTAVFYVPIDSRTVNTRHYGDAWDLSTTEFGELTLKQKEFYWDESNFQDQFPTYDPTLDTNNEFERDFEIITSAFSLKIVMNDTISVTDGAGTQINITIAKGYPIDTLISGANLYFVWYEGFNFIDPYTFDFEISFGDNISVSTAYTGRVNVPASLSSITDWVTYNEIGKVAA